MHVRLYIFSPGHGVERQWIRHTDLRHISATDKLLSETPGVDWTWRGREKPESQLNEGKRDEQLHNMMLVGACETERSAWWTSSVRHGLGKRMASSFCVR